MRFRKTVNYVATLLLMVLTLVLPIFVGASSPENNPKEPSSGFKIVDAEELFRAIGEVSKTQYLVEVGIRTFLEFQGMMAEIVGYDLSELSAKPLENAEKSGGFKILDHEELFKAINEASGAQPPVEVKIRTFIEFHGIKAEIVGYEYYSTEAIEPTQRRDVYPIGGSVAPGYVHLYGPYGAAISIEIYISWIPTDQVCDVGIIDVQTGIGTGVRLYGGSGHAGWSTNRYRSYYVFVSNPSPPNTKTITYNGQIVVWRPY